MLFVVSLLIFIAASMNVLADFPYKLTASTTQVRMNHHLSSEENLIRQLRAELWQDQSLSIQAQNITIAIPQSGLVSLSGYVEDSNEAEHVVMSVQKIAKDYAILDKLKVNSSYPR
ncbi:MAG: hypothetical protein AB7F59_09325 [Bdellovibrionales bacterium]